MAVARFQPPNKPVMNRRFMIVIRNFQFLTLNSIRFLVTDKDCSFFYFFIEVSFMAKKKKKETGFDKFLKFLGVIGIILGVIGIIILLWKLLMGL